MEHSPLQTVVQQRRTIRSFISKDIETKTILNLLNIAKYAPNHKLREPWSFLLIRDNAREELYQHALASNLRQNMYQNLSEEKLEAKKEHFKQLFVTCPVHLIVCMEQSEKTKVWEDDFAATCALIQNFQLLAWELGIGMVWKTNAYIYDPLFYKDMGIDQNKKIVGVLHIGYPDFIPDAKPRTEIEEKLEVRS